MIDCDVMSQDILVDTCLDVSAELENKEQTLLSRGKSHGNNDSVGVCGVDVEILLKVKEGTYSAIQIPCPHKDNALFFA